ncbi:MAG: 1-acyl-sn-glycerol-3-phosphate acyltransferase [Bacteroidales bacterium]|nr:1-acyl-sn-glycerol-3-phosphate acyltransferase [Bacteroidales bacterium]NLK80689.1 glycerol acyltransferase [Bacteroidales bacterium]HPY82021.1 1-acyl-sn-glycerol-3-phosphate acyltransferase [Bacteroidales bacterium]
MKTYINISNVIRKKNPRLYKMLPKFVLSYLKKIIHEDDLNADLRILENLTTRQKFRTFLKHRNFKVEVHGTSNIPKQGRFIFTSNHPLGGLDGIVFYDTVVELFSQTKFLVNDILMNIPGVEDCFLPINKHGANSREYIKKIDAACLSDEQILMFPAGVVSRKINGVVQDLPWIKTCVTFAKKYKRDIIPVYISGKNSNFFYNLANLRKRMGIHVNIEMFFLVNELYKYENRSISITFGKPISYKTFDNAKNPKEWAAYLREQTYLLAENENER